MPGNVKPVPQGYHTVTPYLTVNDAAKAIEFYKKAFGAKERVRMEGPPGKIAHAEIQVGDSMIMLSDEFPGSKIRTPNSLGGTTTNIFLYVENVDSLFNQAVQAGAEADMPPSDMFWGDRYAKLTDLFGHAWSIATHIEDWRRRKWKDASTRRWPRWPSKPKRPDKPQRPRAPDAIHRSQAPVHLPHSRTPPLERPPPPAIYCMLYDSFPFPPDIPASNRGLPRRAQGASQRPRARVAALRR